MRCKATELSLYPRAAGHWMAVLGFARSPSPSLKWRRSERPLSWKSRHPHMRQFKHKRCSRAGLGEGEMPT